MPFTQISSIGPRINSKHSNWLEQKMNEVKCFDLHTDYLVKEKITTYIAGKNVVFLLFERIRCSVNCVFGLIPLTRQKITHDRHKFQMNQVAQNHSKNRISYKFRGIAKELC